VVVVMEGQCGCDGGAARLRMCRPQKEFHDVSADCFVLREKSEDRSKAGREGYYIWNEMKGRSMTRAVQHLDCNGEGLSVLLTALVPSTAEKIGRRSKNARSRAITCGDRG
jgi:hypothetical protein